MRQKLIDEILALHDELRDKRDENEQWDAITEYDCVYSDLLDYEYNQFEDFKNNKELADFKAYLEGLIKE